MATTTAVTADTGRGTLTASTETFSLKSQVDNEGREREYVEGFVATTHLDKGNDRYTPEALEMMAKDITQDNDTVDAVFRDMDESQIGNIDHDNNPAMPVGDTRIVPAFKIVDAQIRDTQDGEKGLWIKGMLNSDGMAGDTVSAVKNSIKDGFLNAFSIEFIAKKVRQIKEDGRVVRLIEAAEAKGAALTGRPMNPEARMTDADLKSMAAEFKDETSDSDNGESESKTDTTMTDDEQVSEEEPVEEEDVKSESEAGEPEEAEMEESGDGEQEEETKSFSEDVKELKSSVQEVKSVNEELREENEELKSELEDLRQLQEIKSEVDEVKSLLEEVELEDGPRTQQEQKRFDEGQETKAEWKQAVDRIGADYLKGKGNMKSNLEAFAENHSIEVEEVKNYVNRD